MSFPPCSQTQTDSFTKAQISGPQPSRTGNDFTEHRPKRRRDRLPSFSAFHLVTKQWGGAGRRLFPAIHHRGWILFIISRLELAVAWSDKEPPPAHELYINLLFTDAADDRDEGQTEAESHSERCKFPNMLRKEVRLLINPKCRGWLVHLYSWSRSKPASLNHISACRHLANCFTLETAGARRSTFIYAAHKTDKHNSSASHYPWSILTEVNTCSEWSVSECPC